MTSFGLAGAPTRSRQHPVCPLNKRVVVSLRQNPCGTAVVGAVPDPGCCCLGGIPYWFTSSTLLLRLTFGAAVFSEDVFVIVQTTRLVDEPLKASPEASSPAFELMKYSVPPLPVWNEPVPGDWAGQTVKPGSVCATGEVALTIPVVSMCCMSHWPRRRRAVPSTVHRSV